ncbi:aminodeoxychorismate lyase [Cellvibrio zantedeschiae]|uniref:Aminodeoxychorismate lyase n=1 Tax=Cellvibrio zantedeschiae TaxID=1237077 RepID=A0ABQ3AY69_9GAMM|nr:aminodeoxychorismate lyase [Cellvibrio zantedeschiae]GGY70590.1 aminodeoxychorismate lyase [Cellvibrio zantedeschiae]
MQHTLPVIAVNGVIDAQVSPLDRGFAYGDGVFETCKLQNAKIPLWDLHKDRLIKSCEKLFIPIAIDVLETQLAELISGLSIADTQNAVVKITVTRGQGGRGYSVPTLVTPTIVIGIFPAVNYPPHYFSDGITVRYCKQRLSVNPGLAGLKHLNRLEQILARAEWNDGSIAEGIMFDTRERLIEGVFSNIFLIKNGEIFTPDLSEAGVSGVMRRFIIETIAPKAGLNIQVKSLYVDDLLNADAIFLCNSLYGVWPVANLIDEKVLSFPIHKITCSLQDLITEALAS